MSKTKHELRFEEQDEKIKVLQWSLCVCGCLTGICVAILFVLSIMGFFWPTTNTSSMCPNEICKSLSASLSSAVSVDEWNKMEKRIAQTADFYTFVNNSMVVQSTSVNYLQSQINNIQDGRCACNLSHFCMKTQCEQIDKKLDERVIGVCEEDKQLAAVGIEVTAQCSEYRVLNSGFYHITAEISNGNSVFSVNIDDVTVFADIVRHISIFEPLVKGDKLYFTVNGTKLPISYSSVFLVSSANPTEYLTKHRMRKDKLYSDSVNRLRTAAVVVESPGWFSTLIWIVFRLIMTLVVLSALGFLIFQIAKVAVPKIKAWKGATATTK